jgi:Fe-S-cluster containining protein
MTGKCSQNLKICHRESIPKKTIERATIPSCISGVVVIVSLVPIPYRIIALVQERNNLFEYPIERLAGIIRDVGFRCTSCAKCCTRAFNGHVFLLDRDVTEVKAIDLSALEPAPDPEFCDQNGTFYVSGYALRAKDDAAGSCWFLEEGRCRIYDRRFSICRIYPYMLHREADEKGNVDWRQISGLDTHGKYDRDIPWDECLAFARETKEYENAFLTHEISFLELMQDHFAQHRLRHVQKVYDDQMRQFLKGEPVTVMVYHAGQLEEHRITKAS